VNWGQPPRRNLNDPCLGTDKSSAISQFLLHVLGCVAELERSFISDRTTAGYEAYRAGVIGVGRKHSKSGKDLGVARHSASSAATSAAVA